MEDLLASIRRAIGEDSATNSSPAGARARYPGDRPQSEILELRNRIAGQLADRNPAGAARSTGFAGILSGDVGLPASSHLSANEPPRPRAESPSRLAQSSGLRQSHAEPEHEAQMLVPTPLDESAYGEERAHAEAPQATYAAPDQPASPLEEHDPPVYRRPEGKRQPAYVPAPLTQPDSARSPPQESGMLSPEAAAGAEAAFGRLADSLMSRAVGERSIEDITRELLRTMLKQWLDEHLPALVERLVREEIERVARRGGR